MRSAYFREQKRYTITDISLAFGASEEISVLLRKLKSYGILKSVKRSTLEKRRFDLTSDEIEISDVDTESATQFFVFDFVGVVTVDEYIIKCFPKYISRNNALLKSMQQLIRVLRKYDSQEQIINLSTGAEEKSQFNMLPIILFMIDYYNNYGPYSNQKDITELNGEGEIDWEKTINETHAVIKQNRPYHLEYFTGNSVDDDSDYFRRLHQCIISDCTRRLEATELNILFSIDPVYPYDGDLSDFGGEEYISYRLNQELNVQFVTRKQLLLKTMFAYISQRKTLHDGLGLSMYGTNSFNLIWEKVCADVFGNLLANKLSQLRLALVAEYEDRKDDSLIALIEKPKWKAFTATKPVYHSIDQTLTPDLISIYKSGDLLCFGIFDAKYYSIRLDEERVEEQPGIGDITKQYLYQLAYNDFIQLHGFRKTINAFLFPSDDQEAKLLGEVELEILRGLANPPLENILVIRLPASKMFEWYLSSQHIDIHKEFSFL